MRATIRSAAAVSALFLAGCGGTTPEPRVVQGECGDVYTGSICTWATLGAADEVVEFGAIVPLAAIEGAPAEMEMAWPPVAGAALRMPAQVTAATGVDHLTMYWEAHGHPPGAYLTPHFDFHFYNIPTAAREAIDCADTTKPTALPADYGIVDIDIPGIGMLIGLCVPTMGMHSALASELEGSDIFNGTMVIGYYGTEPIFFEPMIARDLLVRRESFELPMPTVAGLRDGVRYPRRFRAEYDAAADAYRFIFSDVV